MLALDSKQECLTECDHKGMVAWNLSKKYQPKKNSKEEEEYRYTACQAFLSTLNEMNDYAGQHEVISENMTSQITVELARYVQELKQERKSSKRRFERDCREADRAQQYFEKMDADINVTKADVEKARQQAQIRHQMADDSKADYSSYLQKFNLEQHEYYHTHIPNIFQKIQEMEERRIVRIGESVKTYAELDRQVIPIIGKCLDGIVKAAESVDPKNDSQLVVEAYKSGFEPPGDIEFEDYTQPMKRTVSDNSLSNSRGDGKPELKFGGKSKGKLWPFIKKNKSPKQQKEPLSHRFNEFMTSKPKIHCFRSLKRGGATPEDFSNLPPEQRRKKLQQKVDELNKEIQKEMDQRDAITKMKDVYLKNPQMGDPASLDHKLAEAWLAEVEGRLPARGEQSRRQSGLYDTQSAPAVNNCAQDRERYSGWWRSPRGGLRCPWLQRPRGGKRRALAGAGLESSLESVAIVAVCFPFLSSPDGSYTEEQSQESEVKVLATDFDDEFDDEEPLPAIGTCKALYTFEGQNEGTISVVEGETLYVIEEDKGDGWTRIRRNEDEEGYVPTSYVEVYLDKNAKAPPQALSGHLFGGSLSVSRSPPHMGPQKVARHVVPLLGHLPRPSVHLAHPGPSMVHPVPFVKTLPLVSRGDQQNLDKEGQSEPLQPLASGSFSTRTAAAAALSHAPQSCERIVLADDSAARRPKGEKSRGLPCVPANQQEWNELQQMQRQQPGLWGRICVYYDTLNTHQTAQARGEITARTAESPRPRQRNMWPRAQRWGRRWGRRWLRQQLPKDGGKCPDSHSGLLFDRVPPWGLQCHLTVLRGPSAPAEASLSIQKTHFRDPRVRAAPVLPLLGQGTHTAQR
ncbi:formin-binding protein 1-like protein [Camelus ferus]|nr:formin-binding protein 1-like protein [Camelus ferus]